MTLLNQLLGILLAFGIGAGCRYFQIPLPAPQSLNGALLVFTMTCGFVVTNLLLFQG
ncbi:MAG: XapX domain-containing protein [Gammaproteobacteria bacterium]|nr:XapX domain-containing protein [Gammaproteobacteria bacterium]MCY4358986.1 XapX domain-containing protein [Gammaproteobacteria bacterium]